MIAILERTQTGHRTTKHRTNPGSFRCKNWVEHKSQQHTNTGLSDIIFLSEWDNSKL